MPHTILIVDDSPIVRQQVRITLEQHGFQVEEAHNGDSGLRAFQQHNPDLLIIDVNMPGMSGLDMLQTLRGMPNGSQVPAFIMTTETSRELVARGKTIGATAWIPKPCKPGVLVRGVEHVLKQRNR